MDVKVAELWQPVANEISAGKMPSVHQGTLRVIPRETFEEVDKYIIHTVF